MAISRREFLIQSGLLTAATTSGPILAQNTGPKVLVVGAGAAGLSAAYDLNRAGFDVQVFEAQSRAGGRMYTLREPFSDGLYAEAGAMNLLSTNPGLDYARELGLQLQSPTFDFSLGSLSYFKGQRIVHTPGTKPTLPFDLKPEEQGMTVSELQTLYYRMPFRSIDGLERMTSPEFPQDEFSNLDNQTMEQYWEELGASEDAIDLMMYRYFIAYAESASGVNVLQVAREMAAFMQIRGAFRIAGGNDQICTEMARSLGQRVHFSQAVRAISQDSTGVSLTVETGSQLETVTGDYIVLTPPPPVLRTMDIQSALSESAIAAINEVMAVPVTRIFTQTSNRFWLDEGLDGSAITDLQVGQVQTATDMQPGVRGILESMTYGEQAAALAAQSPDQRQTTMSDAIRQLYPDTAALDDVGMSYAWGEDPWALCGNTAFRPGRMIDNLRALREPQGRVYLSGDTVGGMPGYSNSAFASGKEVAAAIIARA